MNMNWKKIKLGDICELKYGEGLPKRKREKGKFPVYGSGGIIDYHNNYYVEGPGIIVGRKGTIGSVYFEKRNFFPIDTVFYIEPKDENYNIRFLYFLLSTLQLNKLDSDAAVPGLNRNVAYQQKVSIPPLEIQRKIASILSAYDDLIENNTRRIQILEEMAQIIYQEWFVHFRFPGHEKVKFVNSELGKIPEGWDIAKISSITQILGGFPFKSGEYQKVGKYGIVTIKNVQEGIFIDRCDNFLDVVPEKMKDYCLLSDGVILLSLTGNIGRTCLVFGTRYCNFLLNQRVAKLVPVSKEYIPFVYTLCRSKEFQDKLISISTGVAQQNLSPIQMGEIKITIPINNIVEYFAKLVEPILLDIIALNNKNYLLRQTRDLLLPKLISGELDISDLDIVVREQEE